MDVQHVMQYAPKKPFLLWRTKRDLSIRRLMNLNAFVVTGVSKCVRLNRGTHITSIKNDVVKSWMLGLLVCFKKLIADGEYREDLHSDL